MQVRILHADVVSNMSMTRQMQIYCCRQPVVLQLTLAERRFVFLPQACDSGVAAGSDAEGTLDVQVLDGATPAGSGKQPYPGGQCTL